MPILHSIPRHKTAIRRGDFSRPVKCLLRDGLVSKDVTLFDYGCGRAYLGTVEGANLVKIHRRSGKLSYLVYSAFDDDPHPALLRCVRLNLRSRQIDCHDYAHSANPPVLHRKETFLLPDHPLHDRFARLTAQEEKHGLLDDASGIGTREEWARRLSERGFALKGHRLVRSRPTGPANDRCVEVAPKMEQ